MNHQTTSLTGMNPEAPTAAIAARVVASIVVWWAGILLLDFVPISDGLYLRTMHIGIWIYLVELLIGCLKPCADEQRKSESSTAAKATAACDSPLHNFWTASQTAAVGFLWRVPALALGTCLVIVWCGNGPSEQLGAFLPTLVYAIARRHLVKPSPQIQPSSFIRGTLLRTQAYAEGRAPEVNALGPIELANRLGELNEFTAGDQASA